jgi:hypothetical protein
MGGFAQKRPKSTTGCPAAPGVSAGGNQASRFNPGFLGAVRRWPRAKNNARPWRVRASRFRRERAMSYPKNLEATAELRALLEERRNS